MSKHGWVGYLLVVGLASCAASPPAALDRATVVVPGPWVPPDSTLAISNPQNVMVTNPPLVSDGGSCPTSCPRGDLFAICTHRECSAARPGTTELRVYLLERFPQARNSGDYACRRNSNPSPLGTVPETYSCDSLSVHAIGRAIDLGITTIGGDADNSAGDPIANFLIENAEYIGIQRVIWDHVSWRGDRPGRHLLDLSSTSPPHVNHLHIELSVDGADRRTRFFTEGPPTCAVACDGADVVHEDCSRTSCTTPGDVCLTDWFRCGSPEPTEAARTVGAVPPTVSTIAPLARFQAMEPTRLFDTRTADSSLLLSRSDGATSGPLGPSRSGTLPTIPGLPATTSSVWLNVTAVPLGAVGYLSAHPAGSAEATSTVNYAPSRVRANGVTVALGTGGGVTFEAPASDVDAIADLTGAFAATGWGLRTAGPLRVFDSRSLGVPLIPDVPVSVDVRAPADARGVVATLTAVQRGTEAGFVTAFPCGGTVPATSSVNFAPTSVAANTVISALADGHLCLVSNVAVDVIVDVMGFLVPEAELSYQALSPVRWLDTRQTTSLYTGRLGVGQIVELPIQTAAGMPADVRAVTVNLTTLSPGQRGFLTAFPCGTSPPATSSLNFDADEPIAAVSVTAIGSGSLCVFASARTHLIVDLLGVWVPTPGGPPPTTGPGPVPDLPEDPEPTDGGVAADGGVAVDGGVRADASTAPNSSTGSCGCRVGTRPGGGTLALCMMLSVVHALRRRRR